MLSIREKSALVMALSGSRVSAEDPPVIAARSVPPRLGGPLTLETDEAAVGTEEIPQALSKPPAPAASEPATAVFTNSLRLRSMSAPDCGGSRARSGCCDTPGKRFTI